MVIYAIYEKSQYEKLNAVEKLAFTLSGKSKTDTIKAFTEHKNIAKTYAEITPNVYIKKYILSNNIYDLFLTLHGDKKIQCYTVASTDQLILLNANDKVELIKKGVEFYDCT